MLCKTCKHLATMTTDKPAMFLLFGCKLLKKKFGTESDFLEGASKARKSEFKLSDVPIECDKYET